MLLFVCDKRPSFMPHLLKGFHTFVLKMNRKLTRIMVLVLLFLVFFVYRLAFWDDFRYLELLQIVLNAFFDLCVTCLLHIVFYRLAILERLNLPRMTYLVLRGLLFVTSYLLARKLLQALHLFGYNITTGMTESFRKVFFLSSYQVFDTYIVLAFGLILLMAFSFYEKFIVEKLEKEQAEKETTMAELRFLKAQINPHFVFNTLNNIHFLVDENNKKARYLVQEFCDLLRFQLYETANEKVSLAHEVKYLQNYINIQKVRKEDGFRVEFNIHGDAEGFIAPMMCVILLENAFKYSGSSDKDYILTDLWITSGNVLTFKIVNSIDRRVKRPEPGEGGLGLANLGKRLDLIYGDDASLKTFRDGDVYTAELKLKLFKNEPH